MSLNSFRSPWIFTGPVIAILFSHYIVDTYSSVIAPLIGVVQTEFGMKAQWAAILLGVGSIVSGLSQPLFAWISDQTGTRVYGPAGIVLAALGIGLVGYSTSVSMVFIVFSIGMIGVGMFHPIATAKIGAIAGDQRGFALSLFFVFGMAGFFTGSLAGPNLVTQTGTLRSLSYLIIPGLIMAALLQITINKPGKGSGTRPTVKSRAALSSYDWVSITMLYASAVFRFFVNMALIYLIVRWVEQYIAGLHPELSISDVAKAAAPIAGTAAAFMFAGQGAGGLLAGAVIANGREKGPLVLTPIFFSPFVICLAFIAPGGLGYASCFLAGVGFAAMTPITISVGQQLMPGHTRLASGLMLGGAWTFASLGPLTAEYLIKQYNLQTSFVVTGVVLTLAGFAAMGLKQLPPCEKPQANSTSDD